MAHDVFVSYSTPDKSLAFAAVAKLEAARIRCWIAPRDVPAGEPFGSSIFEAIDGARVFLLVLSRHSAQDSRHVPQEVMRAFDRGLVIIPLRIEDIQPTGNIAYALEGTHWLDALTPPVEQHLELMVASVHRALERGGGSQEASEPPGRDGTAAAAVAGPAAPRDEEPVHWQDRKTLAWLARQESQEGRHEGGLESFLATTRALSREEVDGYHLKLMASGLAFVCRFSPGGAFEEWRLFDPDDSLLGRWSVADGWLETRLDAPDGMYNTRCSGIAGLQAMRMWEEHAESGTQSAGLLVRIPGSVDDPDISFPDSGTLWLKVAPHEALLVQVLERGRVVERDLFGGGERWGGRIPAAGVLEVGSHRLTVDEVVWPLLLKGVETGPDRANPVPFVLMPVPPLPGRTATDWACR